MRVEKRKQIAGLLSGILNPLLVSPVTIILLSFKSASDMAEALKWSAILIAFSAVPVYIFTFYFIRRSKLGRFFVSARRLRIGLYLLSAVCALAGYIVLHYLRAPVALVALSVAGLFGVLVFMFINLMWKISLHTAFVTALVIVLIVVYGWVASVTAILIPLVAWARIELQQHSPAQTISGALLAVLIMAGVFYLFGLI